MEAKKDFAYSPKQAVSWLFESGELTPKDRSKVDEHIQVLKDITGWDDIRILRHACKALLQPLNLCDLVHVDHPLLRGQTENQLRLKLHKITVREIASLEHFLFGIKLSEFPQVDPYFPQHLEGKKRALEGFKEKLTQEVDSPKEIRNI